MVRRKDDRPKAIDLRGGLGGRDSERGAQRALESSPGRRAMRGGCARRIELRTTVPSVIS